MLGDISYLRKANPELVWMELASAVKARPRLRNEIKALKLSRVRWVRSVEAFIHAIEKAHYIEAIWKVVCPNLDDPKIGAIYYIAVCRTNSGKLKYLFRSTYGYYGTGCWESATVEAYFEMAGMDHLVQVRSGDYLLTILR